MPCPLPVEVMTQDLVNVVAQCRDVESLANMSLVCHALQHAVRPFLFRHVIVYSPERCHALLDFVQQYGTVRDSIQSLTMQQRRDGFGHFFEAIPITLLSLLQNLRQLRWLNSELKADSRPVSIHLGMLTGIRSHLPHIDTLHFEHVKFTSADEFARLLLAFPGLRNLRLTRVMVQNTGVFSSTLKARLSAFPCLRGLEIHNVQDQGILDAAFQACLDIRHEREYRMLLQHEFHPCLTLPLWTPSPVALGAVGYHSKADGGAFVTLFNAFDPAKTSGGRTGDMPSLCGYGPVNEGSQRQDQRPVVQREMNTVSSCTRPGDDKYSRRYSFPLRPGHKVAHLFKEATVHRYLKEPLTARKWLKANAERVLALYGVAREGLTLVIGTLDAQDYALFVSHEHPEGNGDLALFAAARPGEPWGEFSFSTWRDPTIRGLTYDERPPDARQHAYKVSDSGKGGRWDTVLVACLQFRPDQAEPTSL